MLSQSVLIEEHISNLVVISIHCKERGYVDEIVKAFVQPHAIPKNGFNR